MPSDSETLGFVVIESLASGVPAVGVSAGGLVEIIENGSTGFLVSNGDNYAEMTEKVKVLISDSNLRNTMGVQAREWACKFGWEAATSKLRNK
jgi:sulfoquinovosyltransferase